MFTGMYSESEGWNRFATKETREEVIDWLKENGVDVNEPPDPGGWWNPSPTIICGDNHTIEQFEYFAY